MGYTLKPAARRIGCALTLSLLLTVGLAADAVGREKPLRLAQSQVSAACISNCNSQYLLCSNQCPAAGATSQFAPDINVPQTIQSNRVDILQNQQPIQCRLNCTLAATILLGHLPLSENPSAAIVALSLRRARASLTAKRARLRPCCGAGPRRAPRGACRRRGRSAARPRPPCSRATA
jgi:hypothetical protein